MLGDDVIHTLFEAFGVSTISEFVMDIDAITFKARSLRSPGYPHT